jgi:hypothetical protein
VQLSTERDGIARRAEQRANELRKLERALADAERRATQLPDLAELQV